MLSVASKGGICIWSASYPGNVAPLRSGIISSHCTVSGGTGVRWILVDFLKSPNGEQINALCWSPDGRYLASASYQSSSFTIWDVAQGSRLGSRRTYDTSSFLRFSNIRFSPLVIKISIIGCTFTSLIGRGFIRGPGENPNQEHFLFMTNLNKDLCSLCVGAVASVVHIL